MKTLYIIGGTMGVGKTSTCQILKQKLPDCVFLDGDWCWDMHPFHVNEETKRMVLDNIAYLLNSFIRCPVYKNIIFCWVMHRQEIIDDILSRLDIRECRVLPISLVCSRSALENRLQKDVDAKRREEDVIVRSMERITLYEKLKTVKIDVSDISPDQAADLIVKAGTEEERSGRI